MADQPSSPLLRGHRRPLAAGVLVALALVATCTLALYPLREITSVSSLGVVYLVGVVIVSAGRISLPPIRAAARW